MLGEEAWTRRQIYKNEPDAHATDDRRESRWSVGASRGSGTGARTDRGRRDRSPILSSVFRGPLPRVVPMQPTSPHPSPRPGWVYEGRSTAPAHRVASASRDRPADPITSLCRSSTPGTSSRMPPTTNLGPARRLATTLPDPPTLVRPLDGPHRGEQPRASGREPAVRYADRIYADRRSSEILTRRGRSTAANHSAG